MNPQQILPGRLPGFPLSKTGRNQIEQVASLLLHKKIEAVYASPVLRTKQSGKLLAKRLQIPLHISKSIQEVETPLQGQSVSVSDTIPKYGDSFAFPPHIDFGGETLEHLYNRVDRFVKKILEKHSGGSIVCVSHGDPIMTYHILASGNIIDETHRLMTYDSYIPKSGIIRMVYEDGRLIEKTKLNY